MGRWLLMTAGLLLAAGTGGGAAVEVQLPQGLLRGDTLEAGSGRQVYSFRGIPYAKPPVGDLRFKDPQPSEPWTGARDNVTPPPCPQIAMMDFQAGGSKIEGAEDCLYLHVHTPTLYKSDLPVMVFIHGGGFILGDMESVGGTPLPLLTRDVLLVTIQYRLGVLGFLSTEDNVLPGNLGLKDQTLALRWVHHNIHKFGGDPNKVTIFGVSGGGASVHLQMMVPQSEGLFQRVIMQSGSALCPWATRGDHKRLAAIVSHNLECKAERQDGSLDSEAFLACVQEAPFEKVAAQLLEFQSWGTVPFYMVPRVDGEYLPAHPARLLREGRYHKVDIIAGVCKHEGAPFAAAALTSQGDQLLADFPTLGPLSLILDEEERALYLTRRIYHHYLGIRNITFTEDNADMLEQMYGDLLFTDSHDLASQFHARDAVFGKNVYMYQQEQPNEPPNFFLSITPANFTWIVHGADIPYLFENTILSGPLKNANSLLVREMMLDLWTNFAATGNPTPDLSLGFKWSAASPSNLQYLSLQAAAGMRPDSRQKIREFLNNLPTKQNKMLFPERFGASVVEESNKETGFCLA